MQPPSVCLLADVINLVVSWRLSHRTLHSAQCQDHDMFAFVLLCSATHVLACTTPNPSFAQRRRSATCVWFMFLVLHRLGLLRICISTTIVAHGMFSFIFVMVQWTNKTRHLHWGVQPNVQTKPKIVMQFDL